MMLLSESKTQPLTRRTTLSGKNNKSLPAIDVFAAAVEFMKKKFFEVQETSTGFRIQETDIIWVLTIPAIWDGAAKQFMLEAAVKAGLVDSVESDYLQLAFEPEVAGIYCKTQRVAQEENRRDLGQIQAGDCYMIVDCGGGTIDIAVHELCLGGSVKQIHPPCGGDWGGENVNRAVWQLLKDIYSEQSIDRFEMEEPQSYVDLDQKIEWAKRKFQNSKNDKICFELPRALCQIIMTSEARTDDVATVMKNLAASHKKNTGDDVEYKRTYLHIKYSCATRLFDVSVSPLVNELQRLFCDQKLSKCRRVFVVGGFAECKYLKAKVEQCLPKNVQVLIPNEAGQAVMKGAVMFGLNPRIMEQRISGATYGIKTTDRWSDAYGSRRDLQVKLNGQLYCRSVLTPFVLDGEPVTLMDERTVHYFYPLDGRTDEVLIKLLRRRGSEDVMYFDEECTGDSRCRVPGHERCDGTKRCSVEGVVPVRIVPRGNVTDNQLAVTLLFSEAVIKVLVVNQGTGAHEILDVDFLRKD